MTTTANQSDRSKILDTIMKIAALTEQGSGAFEGEIAAASAKIQELMDKHAVTWAEVQAAQSSKQAAETARAFKATAAAAVFSKVPFWHWDLAALIGRVTHTKHFSISGRMVFWGDPESAEVAAGLYTMWVVMIAREANKALKIYRSELVRLYYHGQRNFYTQLPDNLKTANFRTSWLQGCIWGMTEKVREQEDHRTAETSTALMVLDTQLEKKYEDISKKFRHIRTNHPDGFSSTGFARGHEFGSNIDMTAKPLGSGKSKK